MCTIFIIFKAQAEINKLYMNDLSTIVAPLSYSLEIFWNF